MTPVTNARTLAIEVAIVELTLAIRVSRLADVPALAAAIAIELTEAIASKFVFVSADTAAIAELLLAMLVAIAELTVAILVSSVADVPALAYVAASRTAIAEELAATDV